MDKCNNVNYFVMIKLTILTENGQRYSANRLGHEANQLGLATKLHNPLDALTPFTIRDQAPGMVAHRITGIYFDQNDLAYSIMRQQQGDFIFNSPQTLTMWRDKGMQLAQLANDEMKIVPTFALRGAVAPERLDQLESNCANFLDSPPDQLSYVVKSVRGCRGIGVNLLHGRNSLYSFLQTIWAIKDQRFLIQSYLPAQKEYRLFFVRNRLVAALVKQCNGKDFRNNMGRSGATANAPKSTLPAEMVTKSLAAFARTNALYGACDLLQYGDQYYLLEINLVPGFEQMETLSSCNIAKEILLDALDQYKNLN